MTYPLGFWRLKTETKRIYQIKSPLARDCNFVLEVSCTIYWVRVHDD